MRTPELRPPCSWVRLMLTFRVRGYRISRFRACEVVVFLGFGAGFLGYQKFSSKALIGSGCWVRKEVSKTSCWGWAAVLAGSRSVSGVVTYSFRPMSDTEIKTRRCLGPRNHKPCGNEAFRASNTLTPVEVGTMRQAGFLVMLNKCFEATSRDLSLL